MWPRRDRARTSRGDWRGVRRHPPGPSTCVGREKLRNASGEAKEALARPGRYHVAAGNLKVKEVRVGDGARAQRFVVCHNPEAADRDRAVRANLVAYLESQIEGSDNWAKSRRDELAGKLRTTPALWRLVRRLSDGKFRIDKTAIAKEAKLDGKWLLRTSDDSLTPTDLALAYKQLLEVERGWRDLKGTLGLRPVFHHCEDRIRSHVQLCWLALLLTRVIENATGDTWRDVRHELDRMHLVTMKTAEGRVAQRTATTAGQARILTSLDMPQPGRFLDFELPTPLA